MLKYGNYDYYTKKKKTVLKQEAMLSYKEKIRVWLSLPLSELKNTPLYNAIKNNYDVPDEATLDEVRIIKMFDKALVEGNTKILEMLYKLDGSMSDLTVSIDYGDFDETTEDVR